MSILNLSEVTLGNEFLRIDSEFFSKIYLLYEKKIKERNHDTLKNLSNILSGKTPQYEIDGNIPVVRSGDLKYKWLDENSLLKVFPKNDLFFLQQDDILISSIGFGSIGKVDIYFRNEKLATVSEVTVLRDANINPFYLAQFLSCKYGQAFINKYITGATGQLHLNKSSIKNILVPILEKKFQEKIKEIVLSAFEKITQSQQIYSNTKMLLLEAIGLNNFQPSEEPVNVKSYKESFVTTGRLDAEYYQKKFDELDYQINKTGKGVKLGSFLIMNKRGTQPLYIEAENSIPVLNSKHIRENRIEFSDTRMGDPNETNQELIIKRNDVLLNGTGVGTIGRCAVYLKDEPALPDNHVTILRTNSIDPVYLAVLLNSIIGKMQVDKYFKGSSGQIELYPDDITEFLIWDAPKPLQKQIRKSIEETERLRNQSEKLLDLAKKSVEIAIEQDEKSAMEFIKSNVQ